MKIFRNAEAGTETGPTDYFTGAVHVTRMAASDPPGRTNTASVTFAPGARTVWHTHPAGQVIVITSGQGWVQREGGPVEEVNPGDSVAFAADERHWHGATATTAMTHIAITEGVDGRMVSWLEPVSEAQYRR